MEEYGLDINYKNIYMKTVQPMQGMILIKLKYYNFGTRSIDRYLGLFTGLLI